jgi:hypothetical protein
VASIAALATGAVAEPHPRLLSISSWQIASLRPSATRFFKSQLYYLSNPSFSWLTGVLFSLLTLIGRYQQFFINIRERHVSKTELPFKLSIYLIFTLIGRYQQFIINIRELNVLNNDYLSCSFLVTSQSSHLES